jgi:hypothetical protein
MTSRSGTRYAALLLAADREIEAFANRVREEVDVEPVRTALAEALARTVQPAAATVWLRAG